MHVGLPDIAFGEPDEVFHMKAKEKSARVKINQDLCHVKARDGFPDDTETFYIRAILRVPIQTTEFDIGFGVWVTQSKDSFLRYVETFNQDQSGDGSFGWLAVNIPYYMKTGPDKPIEYIECDVNWGPEGERPSVQLWESDHPWSLHQRYGMDFEVAVQLASRRAHM